MSDTRLPSQIVPGLEAGFRKMEPLLDRIPLLSAAAQQAQQIASQSEIELNQLAPVLEAEPLLAARVLQVANSSFYGFPRQIASIREACVILGQHTLRNLILAAAILDILKEHTSEEEHCLALSRHCAHTAAIARRLAPQFGQSGDVAYTVGLLHDIGSLFMHALLPGEAIKVREYIQSEACTEEQAEQVIFGFDHASLSGAIAQRWNLPTEISAAITAHHDPSRWPGDLTDLIHVADAISSWMTRNEPLSALINDIAPGVMERRGLSETSIAGFLEECPPPDDPDLDTLLSG